ncbi:uncharacterized protein PG998_008659 [Apiospora kogelbergensis]|uniref:uncharacterized protein n=1 Tax=Apiospora kogelbergensis TaxID=1337665 RepID=UPI003131FEEB
MLIIPRFASGRGIFEAREKHPRTYSWIALVMMNVVVEFFWLSIVSVLLFNEGINLVARERERSQEARVRAPYDQYICNGVIQGVYRTGVFHCLFCHGYKQSGSSSTGVLAINNLASISIALHVSRNLAQLTKTVTTYTHGNTSLASDSEAAIGPTAPVSVDSRRITKFVLGFNKTGLTMHFEDGSAKEEAFFAHKPKSKLKSDYLAHELGLELTPQGDIKASKSFGKTSMFGYFAAGDCASFLKTSPNALNTGANNAMGLASHIQSRMYG